MVRAKKRKRKILRNREGKEGGRTGWSHRRKHQCSLQRVSGSEGKDRAKVMGDCSACCLVSVHPKSREGRDDPAPVHLYIQHLAPGGHPANIGMNERIGGCGS